MDIPGEDLPGLMHETTAFVEEPAAFLIDDDPIRIHQHHRRGIPGSRIDRFDMHAVPVARNARALIHGDADAVTGVESRAGRNESQGLGAQPKLRAHHRSVALESTRSENDGIGVEHCCDPVAALNLYAADAMPRRHHEPRHVGFVANFHPCPFCGAEKLFNNRAAAADRLDTGRAGAEIIEGNDEFDAVALQPSNRWDRILRQRAKIVSIGQSTRRLLHIIFKTASEPIGCIEPHVGRAPAGVAAGFGFTRFFKQGDIDPQAASVSLFGRRKCGGKTGGSMSDDNQCLMISRHSSTSRLAAIR